MALILGRTSTAARDFGFAGRARGQAGELIIYSGDGHVATFAPTGTGKTVGPVICNALNHPGQLIVLDMKGEVHAKTADARRAMGQQVHVIDLRDDTESKGSLNPLQLLTLSGSDPAAIGRTLAAQIVERGAGERDRFWSDTSETMIAGTASWLLADCEPEKRRISELFDIFTHEDVPYHLAVQLDQKKVNNRAARAAFVSFLNMPERETRPSVLASVQTHLRLFDSDLVRRVTDTTSLDLDALIAGEPLSLYLIVPPIRLNAYRPLLRLWLTGLIMLLTQRKQIPRERTLMLVDEAGNLGQIDALLTAATLLRSWGLTLWLFFQSADQLKIYGEHANTLVDNAGIVQTFGARNHRMAQDLANLIGGISAQEILNLPKDEQILLIEGKLTRCRQARYYDDPLFARSVPASLGA
jgi:type IV secretion system protein VirD4